MKYIVIGLGNFGSTLSIALTEMGFEVIAVDKDMKKVNEFKEQITHTICLDSGDKAAMETLPLKDSDAVVVAIGEDFGASTLSTAILKQLGARKIIGRAISDLHQTVIEAIGVEEIIRPEEESANRLAKRFQIKGVVDSFEISEDYNIIETELPEEYVNKTVQETNFRAEFNLNILTIIRMVKTENIIGQPSLKRKVLGVVTPNTIFEKGDILVLFGNNKDIKRCLNPE
ncbi:TrkA family potassium uptake protein [Fulvivirga sp. 29W222]|uniref:TrkA family potassium uptake protein n=1 Tax=Fulvivirga marina TaxID=2494733 RepID=A0A937KE58_9BACT|nr:TrkA family potassium uptake protein [Fulvivirga marina]MBL6446883.1 TrkA family potassium uptake protein [Fulvivirga marina]